MKAVAVMVGMLVLSLVAPAQAWSPDVARDMAVLDRAYIPALALTSQGNVPLSRKAMTILIEQWQVFRARYSSYAATDADWRADLAYIDGQIREADGIVASGEHLSEAHEALEGIRLRLLDARQRLGLEYYVDYLTGFHGPMEDIVLSAKDKTPVGLTDADVAVITGALSRAKEAWALVGFFAPDAAVFTLTDVQVAQWTQALRLGTEILEALDRAVRAGDRAEIVRLAPALKASFSKLFMLFGDFDRVK